MKDLKTMVRSLPPVKALRTEKWRRRVLSGLLPKTAAAEGTRDPARRKALIEAREKRDPAVAEWIGQAMEAGASRQTAEDMVWCRLAYGFSFSEYRCYGFQEKTEPERLAFLSDRESVLLSYRLNDLDAMGLFSDKWKTWLRFREYYRRDAVCIGGGDDYDLFFRFAQAHPVFAAKPAFGSCGAGVRRIEAACGKSPRELFAELLSGGKTILEEPIAQSAAMARFHPASVNTVRVVTFRGKDGVRPLWAFLKTGRGGSFTDNGASGGVMAGIDLSEGRVVTSGIDEAGRRYAAHPDTGEAFCGFALPEWEALKAMCAAAASAVPAVRMIGWDAAHTDNGWCIVEGNAQSEAIGPQAVFGRGLRREITDLLKEAGLPAKEYRA